MSEKCITVFEGRKKSFFRYRGLEHVNPQHPPDKQYRDDRPSDMDDPVADRFRFAEIEHDGIVARALKQGSGAIDRRERSDPGKFLLLFLG
jgi:hypothetical protein